MKKIIGIIFLMMIGIFFTDCMPAYVQVEPAYTEGPRSSPPSNTHIWIGGNWSWSGRSRGYVRQNGYWSAPRQGRSYKEGYWARDQRGSRWVNGRWH